MPTSDPSRASDCVLGIDAGSTKTRVALMDLQRGVVACVRGAPCAVLGEPTAATCAVLVALVDAVCARRGVRRADVRACVAGLSGIDFADEHPAQCAALERALGIALAPRAVVNDGIVALWGSSASPAAAILQHGTAITSAYRAGHGREASFDHLDAGRQYDLRTEAVVAVARMIDGRAPATPLRERVLAHLGLADAALFHETVYRQRTVREVSSLGRVVFEAWSDGDAAATVLVDAALADYVRTAAAMAERTQHRAPHVAFGGGVLDAAPARWHAALEAALHARCPGVVVGRPLLGPDRGALVMAAFHQGHDPVEAFGRVAHATIEEVTP